MPLESSIIQHRGTIAIAMLLLLLGWETLQPFRQFYSGKSGGWRSRGKHAIWNSLIGLLNTAIIAIIFVGLWTTVMQLAEQNSIGVAYWFGLESWGRFVAMILLLDVWTYTWHRLNHRIPWLWRFHRLHHADTKMDVTTANRFHVIEIVISSLLRLPVLLLLGANVVELAIYETLMFTVVQFQHANVGLPEWADRILRCIFVTPALHKVHHSVQRREADSNYSSLFSWWDRIFRTWLLMAPGQRPKHYGVED